MKRKERKGVWRGRERGFYRLKHITSHPPPENLRPHPRQRKQEIRPPLRSWLFTNSGFPPLRSRQRGNAAARVALHPSAAPPKVEEITRTIPGAIRDASPHDASCSKVVNWGTSSSLFRPAHIRCCQETSPHLSSANS